MKRYFLVVLDNRLYMYDTTSISFNSMSCGSYHQYRYHEKDGCLIEETSVYDDDADYWDTYEKNVGKILFESDKPIVIEEVD